MPALAVLTDARVHYGTPYARSQLLSHLSLNVSAHAKKVRQMESHSNGGTALQLNDTVPPLIAANLHLAQCTKIDQ